MTRFFSLVNILRFFLTAVAFLYIAQPLPSLSFFRWFPENLFFYIALPGIALTLATISWQRSPTFSHFYSSLLLTFFPVALLFALGISLSGVYHYLAHLSIGLYAIAVFVFWGVRFVRAKRESDPKPKDETSLLAPFSWRDRDHRPHLLGVLGFTFVFFLFGLYHLTQFAAVDEPLWMDGRIGKFWKHLSEQAMDKTLISDKPGITVTVAAGPGLLFVEPKNYRGSRNEFEARRPGTQIEELYLAFRLPLLITITLLLPLFYALVVPLIGRGAAFLAYGAITLSPILIGMSKIVNPDSLLWIFAPLSFLAYLVFLEKRVWRFLVFSGVCLGLALLTKYVANILIVYFFALSILFPLWKHDEYLSLHFLLRVFLLWLGTGLATLYLFVPAFWVEPSLLLSSTIFSQAFAKVAWIFIALIAFALFDDAVAKGRGGTWLVAYLKPFGETIAKVLIGILATAFILTLVNGFFGTPWIDFTEILASPKNSKFYGLVAVYFTNFYPLVFGSLPLLLLGLGTMLTLAWRADWRAPARIDRFTLSITLFVILYSLGSTINGVALINRYQIMLYPLIALLGGLGLSTLFEGCLKRLVDPARHLLVRRLAIVFTIFVFTLSPLLTPFPLSYASSLLPERLSIDIKDMGAGSYEAARYLNQLPGAKETAIWTDKGGVCKFYIGPCLDGFHLAQLKEHSVRYLVLSSGRASRTENRFVPKPDLVDKEGELIRLNTYYERQDFLHEIKINNRSGQTVKIFALDL